MSTPVNKGEGGGQNAQNSVNVVYERPLVILILHAGFLNQISYGWLNGANLVRCVF